MFKIMFEALKDQGVLVTYSAKGSVRRAMQAVGFTVGTTYQAHPENVKCFVQRSIQRFFLNN